MPAVSEAQRLCRCGTPLLFQSDRDRTRKKFCSTECRDDSLRGRRAVPEFREARACAKCGIDYIAVVKKQQFCSTRCSQQVIGHRARLRSNHDVRAHLKRLRTRPDRASLSIDFLHDLYKKQEGRCALTGIAMTWGMFQGRVKTHISLDRIRSYEGYTEDNVQLVCRIANLMKLDTAQNEFVELCRKIVEKADAGGQ